jgi:hypothetical protein
MMKMLWLLVPAALLVFWWMRHSANQKAKSGRA